jgi:hypothetical protein
MNGSHRIATFSGQIDTQIGGHRLEKPVRQLEKEPGTVTGVGVTSTPSAVVHVHTHLQRTFDDAVGFLTFQVAKKSYPTRVFLIDGIIKPLFSGHS